MISMPPAPLWSDATAFIAALLCAGGGIVTILWGRIFARTLVGVLAAAVGFAASAGMAERFNVDPLLVRLAMAAACGVIAAVAARLVWALLAALLCGALAAWALLASCLERVPAESAPVFKEYVIDLGEWAVAVARYAGDGLVALGHWNLLVVLGVLCPAVIGPLALLIIRDRLARVVMTSLLGSAALVAGPVIAAAQLQPQWWAHFWMYGYVLAIVLGVLVLFSLAHQLRAAAAAKAKQKEASDEEEQEAPPPASQKKKDKKKGKK